MKYVVRLCMGCDGCCVFCLNCEAGSCIGARVWEVWVFCYADVVCLCPSCDIPQCCVLHDLQFMNAGRG